MSLKVIDQFQFEFYGDTFTVNLANDRKLYMPMEAPCTAMELQTHFGASEKARRWSMLWST